MAAEILRTNRLAVSIRALLPDGTPVGDYTAILPIDGTTYDVVGERITRAVVRPTLSKMPGTTTAQQGNITVVAELMGGGVSTGGELLKPAINPLLLASSFQYKEGYLLPYASVTGTFELGELLLNTTQADEVVGEIVFVGQNEVFVMKTDAGVLNVPTATDVLTGETSAASFTVGAPLTTHNYHFNSNIKETHTFQVIINKDGHQFTMTGGRVSPKFTLAAGQYGTVTFTGQALSVNPTDVPLPTTLQYSNLKPPVCINMGLEIGDIDMTKILVDNFEMDGGVAIEMVRDLNGEGYIDMSDCVPTAPTLLATLNPYVYLTESTEFMLTAKLGNTRGNRMRFVMPNACITEATDSPQNKRRAYGINYEMTASQRDDREFMLIYF